jgi:hypothetical protein
MTGGWRFRPGLVSSIVAAAFVALAAILYVVLNFKRIHPDNG